MEDISKTNDLSECDLSNLSKTQLIEMIQRVRLNNNETKRQIKKAKENQAKIVRNINNLVE